MCKSSNVISKLFGVAVVLGLLSACGNNGVIKPIQADLIGNAKVRNVTVVSLGAVKSQTVATRVKEALEEETADKLKGNMQVDLKVTLDKWIGSEHAVGGSVTGKLLGSKTELNGVVDVLDVNTGAVLGKYTIYSMHEEGGLLSAQRTVSFVDVDTFVIEKFASFTVDKLQ